VPVSTVPVYRRRELSFQISIVFSSTAGDNNLRGILGCGGRVGSCVNLEMFENLILEGLTLCVPSSSPDIIEKNELFFKFFFDMCLCVAKSFFDHFGGKYI